MDKILTLLTLGIIRFVFVKEGTNQVVTRFGKYMETLEPGLQYFISLWGLLGTIHYFRITDTITGRVVTTSEIDVKEIVYDYPKERVISSDNVQFEVNAVIYFRVFDAYKALFKVTDYTSSLRTLVQSILRSEMGKHDLEKTYSNRTSISQALTEEADAATDEWGIRVIRLEIKEFELGGFAEELLRQKKQDIERRQLIIEAEGLREAKIQEAEGLRQADILRAEGKKLAAISHAEATKLQAEANAQAKKMHSEAEAYGYQVIAHVLKNHPEVIPYLKLHTADRITKNLSQGRATTLYLPNGTNELISTFSVLSDMVKQDKNLEG